MEGTFNLILSLKSYMVVMVIQSKTVIVYPIYLLAQTLYITFLLLLSMVSISQLGGLDC